MFDIQMYTAINLAAGNQSVQVGDVIVGRTSNARGFVADAGSGNYFSLEQVSGRFVNGEVMERDGRVIGTLEAAWTFELLIQDLVLVETVATKLSLVVTGC